MNQKKIYTGLNDREVADSRRKYGENLLTPPRQTPLWLRFLRKFKDPLVIILIVAGFFSICISFYEHYGLDEGAEVFFEPVGIFVAIFLATGMAFFFEEKANRAFAVLNQVDDDEPVEVIRNGNTTKIAKRNVVVGDVVLLNTGAEVPADGVLLEATALHVDESSLTGEPVRRKSTSTRRPRSRRIMCCVARRSWRDMAFSVWRRSETVLRTERFSWLHRLTTV